MCVRPYYHHYTEEVTKGEGWLCVNCWKEVAENIFSLSSTHPQLYSQISCLMSLISFLTALVRHSRAGADSHISTVLPVSRYCGDGGLGESSSLCSLKCSP